MSVELKIKSKHLSLEPAIIKKEEQKILKQIRYLRMKQKPVPSSLMDKYLSLRDHRKNIVCDEARATYLARAYIDGVPYETLEQKRKQEKHIRFRYILDRITKMVMKYSIGCLNQDEVLQQVKHWCKF